jgi:hypothetical protein
VTIFVAKGHQYILNLPVYVVQAQASSSAPELAAWLQAFSLVLAELPLPCVPSP